MQFNLSSLIPCLPTAGYGQLTTKTEPGDLALKWTVETVNAIAKSANLRPAGIQALARWTCWIAYARELSGDAVVCGLPGWRTVLPLDEIRGPENLSRMLQCAGEPWRGARRAADEAYLTEAMLRGCLLPSDTYAPLLDEDTEKLPAHAVAFESLPPWAKEAALFAANLVGKRLADIPGGLHGLNLRWLRACHADFSDCDIRYCDLSHADLRGAKLDNMMVAGARVERAIMSWEWPQPYRSYPALSDGDVQIDKNFRPKIMRDRPEFLGQNEILRLLPITTVQASNGAEAGYTADGKAVIQQVDTQSCNCAAMAMLVADWGGPWGPLMSNARVEGYRPHNDRQLAAAGFATTAQVVHTVDELADQVTRNGAAIIAVLDPDIGYHYLVMDEIDTAQRTASLRDPYHGWAAIVSLTALTVRLDFPMTVTRIVAAGTGDAHGGPGQRPAAVVQAGTPPNATRTA